MIPVALVVMTATAGGDLDAEIALDFLRASSTQSPPGVGSPETMAGQETGMRLRFRARELGGKLSLDVDYQGREPIGGEVENQALRKLYRAEVRYATEHVTFGLGRFIAPAMTFLPVDGANAAIRIGSFTISPYGGRRAISTTLRNLGFDPILPAVGGSVLLAWSWGLAEINGSYSEDRAVLEKGTAGENADKIWGSSSGYARALTRLLDDSLRLGGQIGIAQRADYVIDGPWRAITIDVHAFDVMSAHAFAEWRPLEIVRVGYDFQSQYSALVSGLGPLPALAETVRDQWFRDHGFHVAWRAFDLGWVRADGRVRTRPDRGEIRAGGSFDLDELVELGAVTLGTRGFFTYEAVSFDDPTGKPNLDRALWSLALAVRWEELEAEAGVGFIERTWDPLESTCRHASLSIL